MLQGRSDASRSPFAHAGHVVHFTAAKLTLIEKRFEDRVGFRWQTTRLHLFFGPDDDLVTQFIQLHEGGHEASLINASAQKKLYKARKVCLAKIATAISIGLTMRVTGFEMSFIFIDITHETASHTTIAVRKRMDPQQTVMGISYS